jgi:hypothetical protein
MRYSVHERNSCVEHRSPTQRPAAARQHHRRLACHVLVLVLVPVPVPVPVLAPALVPALVQATRQVVLVWVQERGSVETRTHFLHPHMPSIEPRSGKPTMLAAMKEMTCPKALHGGVAGSLQALVQSRRRSNVELAN